MVTFTYSIEMQVSDCKQDHDPALEASIWPQDRGDEGCLQRAESGRGRSRLTLRKRQSYPRLTLEAPTLRARPPPGSFAHLISNARPHSTNDGLPTITLAPHHHLQSPQAPSTHHIPPTTLPALYCTIALDTTYHRLPARPPSRPFLCVSATPAYCATSTARQSDDDRFISSAVDPRRRLPCQSASHPAL